MEDLMELVAAHFARHGIECDSHSAGPVQPKAALAVHPAEPTALPEHNYRKRLQGDPAP
jgi:hypothetical protein